jgi:transposase
MTDTGKARKGPRTDGSLSAIRGRILDVVFVRPFLRPRDAVPGRVFRRTAPSSSRCHRPDLTDRRSVQGGNHINPDGLCVGQWFYLPGWRASGGLCRLPHTRGSKEFYPAVTALADGNDLRTSSPIWGLRRCRSMTAPAGTAFDAPFFCLDTWAGTRGRMVAIANTLDERAAILSQSIFDLTKDGGYEKEQDIKLPITRCPAAHVREGEIGARAVRMVLAYQDTCESQSAAVAAIATRLGCRPTTLRVWVRQAERDSRTPNDETRVERDQIKGLPLHRARSALPRVNSTSMRGMWFGLGLRFDLSARASCGRRRLAVIAATAILDISKGSCTCLGVADDAPNRWPVAVSRLQAFAERGELMLKFLDQHRLRVHFGQKKC